MKKNNVKTFVAIGVGAALFFVLSTYIAIPTPISGIRLSVHYGVVAVMGMIFGPMAGALMSLIGHFLGDLAGGWGVWWSWIAGSTFFGFVMGMLGKKIKLNDGQFGVKEIVIFNAVQIVTHLLCWNLIAPGLDILIYNEPFEVLLLQGIAGSVGNIISTGVVGTLLCVAYVASRPKQGSLKKEG